MAEWSKEKYRRKLKKLLARSTVAYSATPTSQLPEVVAVEGDAPNHAESVQELEQQAGEDLMPFAMELDPSSSQVPQSSTERAEEPHFDAYVAALQLQDCDNNQQDVEDSDYESDYFSVYINFRNTSDLLTI